jgi:hypothetical protein
MAKIWPTERMKGDKLPQILPQTRPKLPNLRRGLVHAAGVVDHGIAQFSLEFDRFLPGFATQKLGFAPASRFCTGQSYGLRGIDKN